MTIWFDMDGTIADLYGVENWLDMLRANDPTPYATAKPLLRLATLAYMLNKAQANGYKIGVISWLAKNSNAEYDKAVTMAKLAWLAKHLKSVRFDYINIVEYGTPKQNFMNTKNDILFDDEQKNRENWLGKAYTETEIMEVLKALAA
jgi:hypothetical protein